MNGIIIIDKPKGITSHDVVSKIRKLYHIKKVGHTGTLDPNATGVLPILIGNATKLSKYLTEHDKTYIATIKLGEQTDTLDSEGVIIKKSKVDEKNMQKGRIKEILQNFLGKQAQQPPIYSAIKVNGKKLYEYARNRIDVEIPKREIEIYKINLESINKKEREIIIKVQCSKGTYIRTLCKDIAEKLETVGYMKELRRISVNNFNIDNAIDIEKLETNKDNQLVLDMQIIAMEKIFTNFPKIELEQKKLEALLNGVKLTYLKPDGLYKIYNKNKIFQGFGIIENHLLKRDVMEEQV